MGRAHEVRAASMAKTAAIKSKNNAKYGTAVYVAAKAGIPDPDLNPTLKKEIDRAKKNSVPADVIKRAIEKAKGGTNEAFNFIRYEGFGPNSSMIIVDCLTDNVNRTYTSVKTAFGRCGFKLGVSGCVEHMFDNVAIFGFKGYGDEEVLDALIEADCDVTDIEADDDYVTVFAPQTEYAKIRDALQVKFPEIEFEEDETTWIPQIFVELTEDHDVKKYERFREMMDEIDDVQDIYDNVKLN